MRIVGDGNRTVARGFRMMNSRRLLCGRRQAVQARTQKWFADLVGMRGKPRTRMPMRRVAEHINGVRKGLYA